MAQVTIIGSPNYTNGRGTYRAEGWILHWMAGSMAAADATFQNRARNTSAHKGFEEGNVHQYVARENTAYHAGNWDVNQKTIGYEISAQPGRDASANTIEMLCQTMAQDSRDLGIAVNANTVRDHRQIVATQCPGTVSKGAVIARVNELLGQPAGALPPVVTAPNPVSVAGTATVTVDALNVRDRPTSDSPLDGSRVLTRDQTFRYVRAVQGQNVRGVSTWLESEFGNFVWAGGTSYATTPALASTQGGTVRVTGNCNVRTQPKRDAALGGSRELFVGNEFKWVAKVYGDYVGTNNIWYQSSKGNFVWSGNLKEI